MEKAIFQQTRVPVLATTQAEEISHSHLPPAMTQEARAWTVVCPSHHAEARVVPLLIVVAVAAVEAIAEVEAHLLLLGRENATKTLRISLKSMWQDSIDAPGRRT
jgi:hypothetical protein